MLHVMQIHIINTYVFEGGPLEMEREISSGVGKQKGGGGGCQHSTLKIYHAFTFSQTHTQLHSLNTGQRLLNNLTWSHLQ